MLAGDNATIRADDEHRGVPSERRVRVHVRVRRAALVRVARPAHQRHRRLRPQPLPVIWRSRFNFFRELHFYKLKEP